MFESETLMSVGQVLMDEEMILIAIVGLSRLEETLLILDFALLFSVYEALYVCRGWLMVKESFLKDETDILQEVACIFSIT
ncbi:hypothetical protein [Sphingobacterium bambusae]|uniref:Uncharacterized protein n=1 Tax=Sphingobacterium bambusae TaxID=662858 RepID=A0ABW6B8S8_9SPHI|nr:hypothetical protein [Sphingobacterium bambusae]WPL48228.1 hypothetical protein SCB77_19970 [Sphingobacterium bambusae]